MGKSRYSLLRQGIQQQTIGGVMAPAVNVMGIRLWAGDDASESAARALQEALSSPDINIPSGVGRSKWIQDRGLKLVVIEVGRRPDIKRRTR